MVSNPPLLTLPPFVPIFLWMDLRLFMERPRPSTRPWVLACLRLIQTRLTPYWPLHLEWNLRCTACHQVLSRSRLNSTLAVYLTNLGHTVRQWATGDTAYNMRHRSRWILFAYHYCSLPFTSSELAWKNSKTTMIVTKRNSSSMKAKRKTLTRLKTRWRDECSQDC